MIEIDEIIFLYVEKKYSLRDIAKQFNTNHKKNFKIVKRTRY